MESYKDVIKGIEPEIKKSFSFLEEELQKIRGSRVSISLIEDLEVECFGKKFPLKQLAAISLGEGPRELIINPWDESYIEGIEKALLKYSSGSPSVQGKIIKLSFPPLSEEYRKELIQKINNLAEAVRQTIRKWREKAWSEIQEKTRQGEIREDDKYRAKDELQELVDDYNQKIADKIAQKKREIME